jgi:hypothetical protein
VARRCCLKPCSPMIGASVEDGLPALDQPRVAGGLCQDCRHVLISMERSQHIGRDSSAKARSRSAIGTQLVGSVTAVQSTSRPRELCVLAAAIALLRKRWHSPRNRRKVQERGRKGFCTPYAPAVHREKRVRNAAEHVDCRSAASELAWSVDGSRVPWNGGWMTPDQPRAARGLLDWSQAELAARSNLSESTIRNAKTISAPLRQSVQGTARLFLSSSFK